MSNKKRKLLWIILAMASLLLLIYFLYKQIKEHYAQDDPMLKELFETIKPMFQTETYNNELKPLNNRDILKEISLYKGDKSYTINKEKIFLCLKDEKNQYYPKNMLIYVLLHEIAHVICNEIGHTEKFHKIFEDLLNEAIKLEIYNPSIPIIQDYCQHNN